MRRLKLLLIDDEADFLDLLRMILTRKGYDVLTARNGADGLRTLQSAGDIDVVPVSYTHLTLPTNREV